MRKPHPTDGRRTALQPIDVQVKLEGIATATLEIRWPATKGFRGDLRRERLAVLFRLAADATQKIGEFPELIECADPSVDMGENIGKVRLEFMDETEFERAVDLLRATAQRVLHWKSARVSNCPDRCDCAKCRPELYANA